MARLTLRGLTGPHVIDAKNVNEGEVLEPIVTFLNTPTIELPDGEHELKIYKCSKRSFDTNTGKDRYLKGRLEHTVNCSIPGDQTIIL